jgi:hypothetical protein
MIGDGFDDEILAYNFGNSQTDCSVQLVLLKIKDDHTISAWIGK